jgi:hypothetical protein
MSRPQLSAAAVRIVLAATTVVAVLAPAVPAAAAPPLTGPTGLAGLAGLAGPEEPAVPGPDREPTPAVVTAMKRDLGLDAGQIRARQAREATAPDVEWALRTSLGDGFGGAWLSRDGTLNIGITDKRHQTAVGSAGGTARIVAYSEKRLKAALAALDRTATKAPDSIHSWHVDLPTNRVVITVERGQTAAGQAFGRAAGVDSRLVRVVTGTERPRPMVVEMLGADPYVDIFLDFCSVGFAVEGGFVTAGHCDVHGGLVYNLVSGFTGPELGRWKDASFPGQDYGWVRTNPSAFTILPEVRGLGSVVGSREAIVGTAVCRSGSRTGVHCGYVLAKDETVNYPEGVVYGLTATDACADHGDSGGPFMADGQAQGVTSGGSGDCNGGPATTYFQPVNPILSAYGLTLKTVPPPTPWWVVPPATSDRGTIRTDVNGDGRDDIVTFYDYGGARTKLWVFTAKASGGFTPTMQWDSEPGGGFDLTRARLVGGDFNRDGRADIAALYDYGDARAKLWIFKNNGAGQFVTSVQWDTGVGNWDLSASRLTAGDFNGDGRDDIGAFYDYGNAQTKLWVLTQGADGMFTATLGWDTGPGNWYLSATRLVAGDFNGDGRDDIGAFYDLGNSRTTLTVLSQGADGKFTAALGWDTGPGNWYLPATRFAAGDFNGDGRDDIGAFYDYGNAQTKLWVLTQGADGTFAAKLGWDPGPGNWNLQASRMVDGDFDEDGKVDIAALYDYGNAHARVWVLSAGTDGSFAATLGWDSNPGGWGLGYTAPV